MLKPPTNIDDWAAIIESREPFHYASYGDGELACLLGEQGKNCNGEEYTPCAMVRLEQTITHYAGQWIGLAPTWNEKNIALVRRFYKWVSGLMAKPVLTTCEKEILATANANGKIGPLIRAFHKREIIQVGPEHLKYLHLFPRKRHIVCDSTNAMSELPWIIDALNHNAYSYHILVLISAGMAGTVLAWEIAKRWPNVSAMDCGAIFDPYVGVLSRKGYKKPEWWDNMQKNIAEADHV
jgi:hypothetical protein